MAVELEFGEYLALLRSNAEWFCEVNKVPFRPDLLSYICELENYVDRTPRKQTFGRKGFDKWFGTRHHNPYFYASKYLGWDSES